MGSKEGFPKFNPSKNIKEFLYIQVGGRRQIYLSTILIGLPNTYFKCQIPNHKIKDCFQLGKMKNDETQTIDNAQGWDATTSPLIDSEVG